ncbi:flavodoxin family protein [Desulfatibacillum aliphaticivorans]|uniref:flavodoxin family protein n=1 Tax=Desulfatibacillum aliphaticivorans TaxID=218208 RepID=UPI000403448C|nr:flavodoxin family protein [Desulfatibacillum aliphaticivorans]
MKIIALLGTPHGLKGSTARLLNLVLVGAEKCGAEHETIVLKGDNVKPCLGCDVCHKKGACAQKDEFEEIKGKILTADGLLLASPNYIFSVSAQFKAFMDRCCSVVHKLEFEGKYGASIVTSGGGDEEPIAEYMNHFLITTGATPIGRVWATMGTLPDGEFPPDLKQQAHDLGKSLVDAIQTKPEPDPAILTQMEAFKDRMKNLMQWRKAEWPHEYEYWRQNRGLE